MSCFIVFLNLFIFSDIRLLGRLGGPSGAPGMPSRGRPGRQKGRSIFPDALQFFSFSSVVSVVSVFDPPPPMLAFVVSGTVARTRGICHEVA